MKTNTEVNTHLEEDDMKGKIENLRKDVETDRTFSLEHFHLSDLDTGKSHTFEVFDSAPKYFYGTVTRTVDDTKRNEFLPVLESAFTIRGQNFSIRVHPATVSETRSRKDDTRINRQYYPGAVEELVCDVIVKLASQGRSSYIKEPGKEEQEAGVCVWFTLYEVQQELKQQGYTYAISRIKKAIEILSSTHLEIEGKVGKANVTLRENFFTSLAMTTSEDWKRYGKTAKVVVRLNTLIHRSIQKGSFRLLNYERNMALRDPLSRWLHKRLTLMWKGASPAKEDSYAILLSTILNQSGLNPKMEFGKARRCIEAALEELKTQNVLSLYESEPIQNPEKRKGIFSDVKYILRPSREFISEIILANKREKTVRKKMSERALNGKINLDD